MNASGYAEFLVMLGLWVGARAGRHKIYSPYLLSETGVLKPALSMTGGELKPPLPTGTHGLEPMV